jgi:hypothetical protein
MRTDNYTWDITTSVGSTALFVSAARALEGQKPEPLAVDPYAEVFCRAVGGGWADVLDGVDSDVYEEAPAYSRLRSDFGGHFVSFQGTRTKYFDAYFAAAAAADAGVRQIVILAAGLDSRAYRLPWPDGTVVYELAQPEVLAFKRKALDDRGRGGQAHAPGGLRGQAGGGTDRWCGRHVLHAGLQRAAHTGRRVVRRSWVDGRSHPAHTSYLRELGRPAPEDDPDVSPMVGSISLVSATKR